MSIAEQLGTALVEGKGFVIGARGLEKPSGEKLSVLADRVYYLGASSSPDLIFVTKVTDDKIFYKSYPFDGSDKQIEMWIGRDLISRGTNTYLKQYGKFMFPDLKRSLEDMLAGGQGKPEKMKDWKRVYVLVQAAPGVTGDLWYEAEKYGSVGSIEKDGVTQYEIRTDGRTLAKLKKDKQFVIIKTGDKPLG